MSTKEKLQLSGSNEEHVARAELGRYGGQHTATRLINQVFIYMQRVDVTPIHHPSMDEDKHLMQFSPTAPSSVSDGWLRKDERWIAARGGGLEF